jgi:deoxyribodipyrimidine photo-lyase
VLRSLAEETGAQGVHWTRLYAPDTVARDRGVKTALRDAGLEVGSHPGHLLHEPWTVKTKGEEGYKVFTPFWKALRLLDVDEPLAEPRRILAPDSWPASDDLDGWHLGAAMDRGAAVVASHVCVGEVAARTRLDDFLKGGVGAYASDRDRPDREATSRLSENLTYGEISPRTVWHGGLRARAEGAAGAETFLKELAWREFAWHLLWHTPRLATENWRAEWDGFPWRGDNADAERWRRGLTGEPMVDAGMREMYVTGTMHNRVRMLVASYLTKHLMTDWRVGLAWFADCLIDWDPASNALGWQWVAGSGSDAAPYFRVFNPATQAEKFDPEGSYRRRFVTGHDGSAEPDAGAFFDATPRSWGLRSSDPYPGPMVDLQEGREAALAAYKRHTSGAGAADDRD